MRLLVVGGKLQGTEAVYLAAKAGCAPSAWRGKDVSVSIYHVEAFEEPK